MTQRNQANPRKARQPPTRLTVVLSSVALVLSLAGIYAVLSFTDGLPLRWLRQGSDTPSR